MHPVGCAAIREEGDMVVIGRPNRTRIVWRVECKSGVRAAHQIMHPDIVDTSPRIETTRCHRVTIARDGAGPDEPARWSDCSGYLSRPVEPGQLRVAR